MIETFKRFENKYLISIDEYEKLMELLSPYLVKDKYYDYNIRSVYLDTPNYDLINKSLEKPIYKEKIRIRSYGKASNNDNVFFEVKKKYMGITNKRRIITTYDELNNYFENNIIPKTINEQIFNELDYYMKYYDLKPSVYISYNRLSYFSKDNENLRITFDKDLKYRLYDLDLSIDHNDKQIIENKYIMEIKTLDSFPLWLVKILSTLKIYPTSFSKYGSIYLKEMVTC